MEIRLAELTDFDQIKPIFENACKFMVANGNLTQWHDQNQLAENILQDIKSQNCYLCMDNDKIAGVFCFFIGEEKTYKRIYNGAWLNDNMYGVIHRIAVAEHNKGVATYCIQWCLNKFPNIKIDTHKDNIPMQKTILKNGFTYCGIIKKEDGTERLAYQFAR